MINRRHLPTRRYRNARCLQSAQHQELEKIQHDQAPLKPGEVQGLGTKTSKRPSQGKSLPTINPRINHLEAKKPNEVAICQTKRREKPQPKHESAEERAKRAAKLAENLMENPKNKKALLVRMTLDHQKTSRRVDPNNTWTPKTSVIPSGFLWKAYPPLIDVLTENEEEFYQLSIHQCHSNQQFEFTSRLIRSVKQTAANHGMEFDPSFFSKDNMMLRHRICAYYSYLTTCSKKHLMNMIRNPTEPSNTKSLCELLEFLEEFDHQQQNHQTTEDPDSKKPSATVEASHL